MNYRSIELTIDKRAAQKTITKRVPGLIVRESASRIEFSTPAGFHLATLTDVELPTGQRGTRLKYRTAILSAWAAHARRKARKIRDAVSHHQYQK